MYFCSPKALSNVGHTQIPLTTSMTNNLLPLSSGNQNFKRKVGKSLHYKIDVLGIWNDEQDEIIPFTTVIA